MTWTKLHAAVEHQETDVVLRRTRSNSEEAASVDDHGSTPLHIACYSNPPTSVLRALIDAHPQAITDKDVHGDTPLHIILSSPSASLDAVRLLLETCPTVASVANKEGLMPIHVACRFCQDKDDIIGLLVEQYPFALRTRIKMGNPVRGRTDTAPKKTDHFVVDAAARTGASAIDLRFRDRNHQIRDGAYPLHMAVAGSAPLAVIEMLLKEAPDVLAMGNKYGSTPLHVALERGRDGSGSDDDRSDADLVELLLSVDARVARIADRKHGNLPLHVACSHGCGAGVAKILLKAYPGAIHRVNADNMTPLQVAEVFGKCGDDTLRVLALCEVDAIHES